MRGLYIAVLLALPTAATALELDETSYRDRKLGIRLDLPEGWILQRQTGYPSMPALLLHQEGHASISLSIGPEGSADRMAAFVKSNAKGLAAVAFKSTPPRQVTMGGANVWLLEISDREGKVGLKQLYLAHAKRALILTLAAPRQELQQYTYDLTQALQGLTLTRPVPAAGDTGPDVTSLPRGAEPEGRETTSKANRSQGKATEAGPAQPSSSPAGEPGPELQGIEEE
jgi:hypothetical protein